MFIMHMPESFKVGDTNACRINGEPTQLTWLSPDVLIIGAADFRQIVKTDVGYGLRVFFCGDADNTQYDVEEVPGEGCIIFPKPQGGAS
jgi:hypothetical protein